MIPVWPENTNYYAAQGSWQLLPSDGRSRTSSDMDSGQTRDRRRFTRTQSKVAFAVELTSEEFERFVSFYANTLLDGTLWFIMPIYTGKEYRNHLVKFDAGTLPAANDAGYQKVVVPFSLIIGQLFVVSEGSFWLYDTYGGDLSLRMIDAVARFTTSTYPDFSERLPTT